MDRFDSTERLHPCPKHPSEKMSDFADCPACEEEAEAQEYAEEWERNNPHQPGDHDCSDNPYCRCGE